MKSNIKFRLKSYYLFAFLVFSGCTKEFDYGNFQDAVETISFSNLNQTSVEVSGNVKTDNGASINSRGICYGFDNNPLVTGQKKEFSNSGLGNYTCLIDNLSPSTTYYARAYATNGYGTAYGKSVTFTTLQATIPIVSSTTSASSITTSSAITGGNILSNGASNITSRGVCYSSTSPLPNVSGPRTVDGTGVGFFVSALTGLAANTTYYIRAYAINGIGTAYGDVKTFRTNNLTIPVGISTIVANSITQTAASSGGNITNDGGSSITARGVCWSNITSSPTITNSSTNNGSGIGSFSSSLTTLTPGTTYFVRAYATNNVGTAYGNVITFTTIAATIPIGISTSAISLISQNSANGGGVVIGDGGSAITSRGVCWSSSTSSPTVTNSSSTNNGSGIGSFSSALTTLTSGTTYFVRAYATNNVGTAYGNVITFTTIAATIPIGITTTSLSSITQNSANSGGSVTGDGGSAIISRGVCWSNTTSTPTIQNNSINNGTGIGTFSCSLTGLLANTTYYLRAYATNSVGTAYGNTLTFTTLPNLSVGQSYQGGVIAYIFVLGDIGYVAGQTHGLISTTSNQSTGAQWGCSTISIIGTNTALGTGLANTTAIVNSCFTTNIAAALCNNLTSGGYTDWYLPSREELNKLYLNRAAIGGFINAYYWSSSQSSTTTAWSINFTTGIANSISSKTAVNYVRAVRNF